MEITRTYIFVAFTCALWWLSYTQIAIHHRSKVPSSDIYACMRIRYVLEVYRRNKPRSFSLTKGGGGGRAGASSFVAYLGHLTVDHASLLRRNIVFRAHGEGGGGGSGLRSLRDIYQQTVAGRCCRSSIISPSQQDSCRSLSKERSTVDIFAR